MVREVADALSGVHGLGLYHRRINPETVIVTPTGQRQDRRPADRGGAAAEPRHRAAGRRRHRRAGRRHRPRAPAVRRPRVAAGRAVPRTACPTRPAAGPPLDDPAPGPGRGLPRARRRLRPGARRPAAAPRRRPSPTANALVNALTKVLGHRRRVRRPGAPAAPAHPARRRPDAPGRRPDAGAPPGLLDQPTEPTPAVPDRRPGPQPAAAADAAPLRRSTRSVPRGAPRPAPAVRDQPPSSGRRATGPPARAAAPAAAPAAPLDRPARRRWCVLLAGVGLTAGLVLSRQLGAAPDPGRVRAPAASTRRRRPPPRPCQVPDRARPATSTPRATTSDENPDEVRFAVDGDPETRWRTVTYIGNPKLGGIKRGVGLVLDLGAPQPVGVGRSSPSAATAPTWSSASPPTTRPGPPDRRWPRTRHWRRSSPSRRAPAGRATLTPEQPVTTRFVLVYLTSLPKEGRRYRGGIYEVEVRR